MPLREVEKGNIVPRKRGRPPGFTAEANEQAFRLALLGATDEEMAEFFHVTRKTLDNWKRNAPGFLAALERGKTEADARVAESLYKRALGYSHPAVKIFNNEGQALVVPYTEHYPPDTNAANTWLRNRANGKWSKAEQPVTVNVNVEMRNLSEAEIRAQIAAMAARIGAAGATDVVDESEAEEAPDEG